MNNSFWNKKIPSLFGFMALVIGVGLTIYLTRLGVIPFLQASVEETPIDLRITNITDTSFTVTYKTAANVLGSVSFGKDSALGQISLDERDKQTGIATKHTVHSITLRDLKPNTKYYYSIISGSTTFLNNGVPFITSTGPVIAKSPPQTNPISGKISIADSTTPVEILLYATYNTGQTLSTLVKENGTYILPLNSMRTGDLALYVNLASTDILQLLATSYDQQSFIRVPAKKYIQNNQNNIIATISLGNNYDFTLDTINSNIPTGPVTTASSGFPVFALNSNVHVAPKIDSPKNFTDPQPLLKGTALPNATVKIVIHSDTAITGDVTADQNGNWAFRPTTPLAPGMHTITMVTKDEFGILKTVQQTFNIFKDGTQVAEAATPSASPIVVITPTSNPVPTVSSLPVTPTPIPTISLVPTPTPKIILAITPTTVMPKNLPKPGSESVVFLAVSSVVTTLIGISLFFFTKGASL